MTLIIILMVGYLGVFVGIMGHDHFMKWLDGGRPVPEHEAIFVSTTLFLMGIVLGAAVTGAFSP